MSLSKWGACTKAILKNLCVVHKTLLEHLSTLNSPLKVLLLIFDSENAAVIVFNIRISPPLSAIQNQIDLEMCKILIEKVFDPEKDIATFIVPAV